MSKPYHRTQNPRMLKTDLLKAIAARGFKVRDSRVVAHNVVRFTTDETYPKTVCWYTGTPIVIFIPNNMDVILNTGGFYTMRTAKHMNDEIRRIVKEQNLPDKWRISVGADRGKWSVYTNTGETFRMFDGIHLHLGAHAEAVGEKTRVRKTVEVLNPSLGKRITRRMDSDAKRIELFCKLARAEMLKNGPITPHGGDCWRCAAIAFGEPDIKEGQEKNGQLEVTSVDWKKELFRRDPGHFMGHVKERYIHGTLIACALKWAGWEDKAIGYWYGYLRTDARQHDRERTADLITHHLRRFLKHHAGLPHR